MKVVWMIFHRKYNSLYEHKQYSEDELHSFYSLEAWDDVHYTTEEEAVEALKESILDDDDQVIITKVYIKA